MSLFLFNHAELVWSLNSQLRGSDPIDICVEQLSRHTHAAAVPLFVFHSGNGSVPVLVFISL